MASAAWPTSSATRRPQASGGEGAETRTTTWTGQEGPETWMGRRAGGRARPTAAAVAAPAAAAAVARARRETPRGATWIGTAGPTAGRTRRRAWRGAEGRDPGRTCSRRRRTTTYWEADGQDRVLATLQMAGSHLEPLMVREVGACLATGTVLTADRLLLMDTDLTEGGRPVTTMTEEDPPEILTADRTTMAQTAGSSLEMGTVQTEGAL